MMTAADLAAPAVSNRPTEMMRALLIMISSLSVCYQSPIHVLAITLDRNLHLVSAWNTSGAEIGCVFATVDAVKSEEIKHFAAATLSMTRIPYRIGAVTENFPCQPSPDRVASLRPHTV